MNYAFDDLARALASGISRREALKRMGAGFTGLLLSSMGFRKAFAATTCGTCQACDLDTNTCGLACTPASTAQTLCALVAKDGSYIRLVTYLAANGYTQAGASDAVVANKGGVLYQSVLLTNFTNSGTPSNTASIGYAVSPAGDITTLALVFVDGVVSYALSIDYDGKVVQTIATHTSNTSTPTSIKKALSGGASSQLSPGACGVIVDIVCGVVVFGAGICYAIGLAVCAEESVVTLGIGAIPCAEAVNILCGLASYAACEATKDSFCDCPLNQQNCNGTCCDTCMDCLNGACIPNITCPDACCNNICCASGYTCVSGQCTSPDEQCVGETCGSFVSGCLYNNDECFCGSVIEGGGVCWCNAYCDAIINNCTSSADCPDGSVCAIDTCCEVPVCLSICTPGCTLGDVVKSTSIPHRPTAGHR